MPFMRLLIEKGIFTQEEFFRHGEVGRSEEKEKQTRKKANKGHPKRRSTSDYVSRVILNLTGNVKLPLD